MRIAISPRLAAISFLNLQPGGRGEEGEGGTRDERATKRQQDQQTAPPAGSQTRLALGAPPTASGSSQARAAGSAPRPEPLPPRHPGHSARRRLQRAPRGDGSGSQSHASSSLVLPNGVGGAQSTRARRTRAPVRRRLSHVCGEAHRRHRGEAQPETPATPACQPTWTPPAARSRLRPAGGPPERPSGVHHVLSDGTERRRSLKV